MSRQIFTDEEYAIGKANGISRNNMCRRLRRGWRYEDCYTIPPKVSKQTRKKEKARKDGKVLCGRFVSDTQLATAADNGIKYSTLWARIDQGMDVETAISKPTSRGRVKADIPEEFDSEHIKDIVSRIKGINRQDKSGFPVTIPKPLKRKAQRLGINFDEIEPISKLN